MPAMVLVIGYGNTLRGDDGIGPAVAREIDRLALPDVRVIVAQQLTPELAADLADARRVVFVDAAITDTPVRVAELAPDESDPPLTHAPHPGALLALARAIYGHSPEAWLMTVTGENFDHQEGLSELARAHVLLATSQLQRLVRM